MLASRATNVFCRPKRIYIVGVAIQHGRIGILSALAFMLHRIEDRPPCGKKRIVGTGLLGMEKARFQALYVVIEDEVLNYRWEGLVISLGHGRHSKE
jgi:hypothetical protein